MAPLTEVESLEKAREDNVDPTTTCTSHSHFTVGQDMSVVKDSMCSIFKKDFPIHDVGTDRRNEVHLPKLADVMHKDDRYFNEKASESVKSFQHHKLPKPELRNTRVDLSATNFKMDSDTSKFKLFDTTHNTYFTPKIDNNYQRAKPNQNTTKSHISLGDMEKEHLPASYYKYAFQGHDTTIHKVKKAPTMHQEGSPTIKGDGRLLQYTTTHNTQFQGRWVARVKAFSAPTGTNIPTGDPEKEVTYLPTMKESYPKKPRRKSAKAYNKEEVNSKLQKTNFSQGDGKKTWEDYESTATLSYRPNYAKYEKFIPSQHRNHSDLPEGDLDPQRNGKEYNMTTSMFHHGNPARGHHNVIISGADLRTKSNVLFGLPHEGKMGYDTTTDSTFKPVSVPYLYNRTSFYTKSAIPVDYFNNDLHRATTYSDFQDPRCKKIMPNPDALENLKKSSVFHPSREEQSLLTHHRDTFTPKKSTRHSYDAGRLQKSSVPLGTLIKSNDF